MDLVLHTSGERAGGIIQSMVLLTSLCKQVTEVRKAKQSRRGLDEGAGRSLYAHSTVT